MFSFFLTHQVCATPKRQYSQPTSLVRFFHTDFLKLEIHPDPKYLLPDPIETLKATEQLAAEGFHVLPYIQADPVLCKRLEDVGSSCRNAAGGSYRHQQRTEDTRPA